MAPRIILITGASGGIGAALAQAYAAPGVTLVLWGRDTARLATCAADCRAKGAQALVQALDLRDAAVMTAALAAADDAQPIDLAIFNAGIGGMPPKTDIAESPQSALATAEVNFVAPIIGANVMAERMAQRGHGHIVLMGSVAASYPLPQAPTYAATKAGLRMFARALSMRLEKHKVYVTLVEPGFIDTAMSRQVPPPKPFLISADAAVQAMLRGIAAKKRHVVVPWQYHVIGFIAALIPPPLLRLILSRT